MTRLVASLAAIAVTLFASCAQAESDDIYGVWRNPHDSVHLDIRACGASACGYVVWASPKADKDSRDGSGQPLVGQQLLRDFAPSKGGWRGRVFVPDLNRTFSGSAHLVDAAHIEAQGCLIGNFLCKHQVWTRIGDVQASR